MKKKIIFMLIGLVLSIVLLCSCNSNKPQPISSNLPGNNELNNSLYPLNQEVNGYITSRVGFKLEPNYYLGALKWIDDENLLVVVENYPDEEKYPNGVAKIYLLNTNDMSTKQLFKGVFYGDPIDVRLKIMADQTIGLIGASTFLVFDRNNLNVVKEIQFPEDKYAYDVSRDGKKVVYINKQGGLYYSNIDFSDPVLLAAPDKKPGSRTIRWSPDDQNILYTRHSTTENIICVIDPITKTQREYGFTNFNLLMGQWFTDGKQILIYSHDGQTYPKIEFITLDSTTGKTIINEMKDYPSVIESPCDNKILYKNNAQNQPIGLNASLGLYDLTTQNDTTISPSYIDITAWALSNTGQSIAFIGILSPDNLDIFITRKMK